MKYRATIKLSPEDVEKILQDHFRRQDILVTDVKFTMNDNHGLGEYKSCEFTMVEVEVNMTNSSTLTGPRD